MTALALVLWGKFKLYIAGAVALFLAVLFAFLRVKQIGADEERAKQEEENARVQQEMSKVDTSNLSADSAFKRLRDRASRS